MGGGLKFKVSGVGCIGLKASLRFRACCLGSGIHDFISFLRFKALGRGGLGFPVKVSGIEIGRALRSDRLVGKPRTLQAITTILVRILCPSHSDPPLAHGCGTAFLSEAFAGEDLGHVQLPGV